MDRRLDSQSVQGPFLTLAVLPVEEVGFHKDHLLAHLGDVTAGGWLKLLISVDAALVLSGAVLTSYVGVTGWSTA
ncbi:MAG: hypothetical protein Ct9H300mP1_04900 [Planctomycetaceae bacterium]|nr:MAG: hypothetical protein Ct9H300mP1_04900 [Planctomycetaceae bacterium]